MLTRRITATVALAALVATGCSSAEDSPSPSPSASATATDSPTPGVVVGKEAFALTLPQGWTEQDDAGGAVLLGVSGQTGGGYPTNVNIVSDPTLVAIASEQLASTRTDLLTDDGATDINARGSYEVDGEQGVSLDYRQVIEGISVDSTEIAVARNEAGYIMTFSFALGMAPADRDAIVAKVMDTWTWSQ